MISDSNRRTLLTPPKGMADLVLDTDAYNEIDDQFAISYAIGAGERINLKAFYAAPFLNERSKSPADGMEKSYLEIKKLLALAGKNYPVCRGSSGYLSDEKTPCPSEAALDLTERAMGYTSEHPLYVASIGAITNIASALLLKPEISERIVVIWLGGNALHWPHNREFNCSQDVAAARVVFNSGAPLVLLPCMGTASAFTTTGPELDAWLSGKNSLCDYLVSNTKEAAEKYARNRIWSRVLWDVTAIGWLMNEDEKLMLSTLVPTPIPEYDHHYSQDFRRPLCSMVYHINRDALFADLVKHLTQ